MLEPGTPLLTARGIDKRFDGVVALDGADFSVSRGEVHALVGENGAGKSTLSKIIAGVLAADAGRIRIEGRPADLSSPVAAQRAGLSMIFQEMDLFPHLTVAENLVVGNLHLETARVIRSGVLARQARPFLRQVGLSRPEHTLVAELPIGEQQLVAIARALAMQARLIIMDEPTSSLSKDAVKRLFGLIRRLRDTGVSVVFVSHKMDEVFDISDRITVLRDGQAVGTLETALTTPDHVIRLMIGRTVEDLPRGERPPAAALLLAARGLRTAKLRDVTFDIHRGEVLGVAGLVGSGRSELGAALFGLDPILAGELRLGGEPFVPRSPRHAMSAGVGLLPEDRKQQGLMMQMSVQENTSVATLARVQVGGVIRTREERARVDEVHRRTLVKAPSRTAPVSALSGGNQQKVLISRWLLVDPDVMFLDDPTRGIDVGAKQDVHALIDELVGRGKAVILVSSELPELLRHADHILVLQDGCQVGLLPIAEAGEERIMSLAARRGTC